MNRVISNKYFYNTFSLAASYFVTLVTFYVYDNSISVIIDFVVLKNKPAFLMCFILGFFLIKRALSLRDRRIITASCIFSFLFSISIYLGSKIDYGEKTFSVIALSDIIVLIGLFFGCFAVFSNVIFLIISKERSYAAPIKRRFFLCWGIIALAWLPYYLLMFPGNLTPDSIVTINQCIGISELSNHHPIMFTMFVNIFIQIGLALTGSLNTGIAIFTFVQLLIMSFVMTFTLNWMMKKGLSPKISLCVLIFFALNPVLPIYAVTVWKDIFFGCWILLMVLFLYDVAESKGKLLETKKGILLLVGSCLLVAFGRNNGLYILAAVLLVVCIYARKNWKRLVPISLCTIIAISIIQGPLYSALGIRSGDFAESLAIPLQQIVYTAYSGGEITEDQKAQLNEFMDLEGVIESYNPSSVDPVKGHVTFDNEYVNTHKGEIIKLWLEILPSNFSSYVKAWLMQTKGYWNWGTNNWVIRGWIQENDLDIYEIYLIGDENLRTSISTFFDTLRRLPVVENIYSISASFWCAVICAFVLFIKKRFRFIIPLIPLFALWGTMMIAAPVFCEFRYVFAFHLSLPFMIFNMFYKKEEKKLVHQPINDFAQAFR